MNKELEEKLERIKELEKFSRSLPTFRYSNKEGNLTLTGKITGEGEFYLEKEMRGYVSNHFRILVDRDGAIAVAKFLKKYYLGED